MTDANPLLDAFVRGPNRSVQKWLHYFDAYHRLFASYRNKPITFLEIGVQNGGSALMWQEYFGPQAKIIGVDIDPRCRALEAYGFKIHIGDQGDPAFWDAFLKQHPSIDIVLDDGGHSMRQQLVTFDRLFPAVTNGGLFVVEDCHSSYFPIYGGGKPGTPGTWIEKVKALIDEMHAWYHAPIDRMADYRAANEIPSITIHDSIVAIEKRRRSPPIALALGGPGHIPNPPTMDFKDMRRALRVPDAGPA